MAKDKLDTSNMNEADLQSMLINMQNEYQQMKFDHATKGLSNPMELRWLRRDIARIHTEARRREIANMTAEELEMRAKIRARRCR